MVNSMVAKLEKMILIRILRVRWQRENQCLCVEACSYSKIAHRCQKEKTNEMYDIPQNKRWDQDTRQEQRKRQNVIWKAEIEQ